MLANARGNLRARCAIVNWQLRLRFLFGAAPAEYLQLARKKKQIIARMNRDITFIKFLPNNRYFVKVALEQFGILHFERDLYGGVTQTGGLKQ